MATSCARWSSIVNELIDQRGATRVSRIVTKKRSRAERVERATSGNVRPTVLWSLSWSAWVLQRDWTRDDGLPDGLPFHRQSRCGQVKLGGFEPFGIITICRPMSPSWHGGEIWRSLPGPR